MKKTLSILLCLALMLSLGITAFADNDSLMPEGPYSLTIYKYRLDDIDGHEPALVPGNGESATAPTDAVALEGVTFTVTLVDADNNNPVTGTDAYSEHGDTDSNGRVEFTNILTAGKYHVVETAVPGSTSTPVDCYVDLPMTNVNGTGWLKDVILYPKNELVSGAVIMTKTGEGTDSSALQGATFKLQKSTSGSGTDLDPYNWEDFGTGSYTTDAAGKFTVGQLPSGHYRFVETAAPAGYGLNNTPVEFEITASGTVMVDDSGTIPVYTKSSNAVPEVSLQNYKTPDIDKKVDLSNTRKVGDEVTFEIEVDVPGDIAHYTQYVVTDTLTTAQLGYITGSLNVQGKEATGAYSDLDTSYYRESHATDETSNTLTVTFLNPTNLVGLSKIKLSFKTTIGSLDTEVQNTATITYDNGYGGSGSKETTPDPTDPTDPVLNKGKVTITKYDKGKTQTLSGAKFSVYATSDDAQANTNPYVVDTATNEYGVLEIDDLVISGDATVAGVNRTFYLVETKAPTGYKLLDDVVSVDVEWDDTANAFVGSVEVENESSSVIDENGNINLPSTGGVGTLIFTVVGLAMILGGGYMISKKRREG